MMKKIFLILIFLSLCLNVSATGNFTGTYNTDIYINANLSTNALADSKGGVSHIDASINGRLDDVDNYTLRVYGFVNVTHLNGTNYSKMITPYFSNFFWKAPTINVGYTPGVSDAQYAVLPGTEYSYTPNNPVITVSDYSISITWDEFHVDVPELVINDSLGFTIFMGQTNTTEGGGGNFPYEGENRSHGAVFTPIQPHQTGLYITNLASTVWVSGLSSTTSTTTTSTTVTTSTLLNEISIDINVTLSVDESGESLGLYQLFVWDCPASGYEKLDYSFRLIECDNIASSQFFTDGNIIEENISGDKDYIIEASRSATYHLRALKIFNPVNHEGSTLVNILLSLDVKTNPYSIAFSSEADPSTYLIGVEYEIYDWDLSKLIISGNTTDTNPIFYNYSKTRYNQDIKAFKEGFTPVIKGTFITFAESGWLDVIGLIPNNFTHVSLSGYVLSDTGVFNNADVIARCDGNSRSLWDRSDATGFYNITGINGLSVCEVFTNVPNKINANTKLSFNQADKNDVNFTLSGSSNNVSIEVIVRGQTSGASFVVLSNIGVSIEQKCGTSEPIKYGNTNLQGSVTFSVKSNDCDYEIIANYNDGNKNYVSKIETKNSANKIPLLISLQLLAGDYGNVKLLCKRNGALAPFANVSLTKIDGSKIVRTCNSDSIARFDLQCGQSYNYILRYIDGEIGFGDVFVPCSGDSGGEGSGGDGSSGDSGSGSGDGSGGDSGSGTGGGEGEAPIAIDPIPTAGVSLLDGLWAIVLNASPLFESMLVLILMTMFIKTINALAFEISGGVFVDSRRK